MDAPHNKKFPFLLFDLINAEANEIIDWSSDGYSFVIKVHHPALYPALYPTGGKSI